jgi:hypothetical protein
MHRDKQNDPRTTDNVTLFLLLSQVSHHPPAAAHHVTSQRGWTLWQEITIDSKFRGKYISVMPLGEPCIPSMYTVLQYALNTGYIYRTMSHSYFKSMLIRHFVRRCLFECSFSLGCIHLQFHSSGNHYVWGKVTSTVHNIIVGKLWIDQVSVSHI